MGSGKLSTSIDTAGATASTMTSGILMYGKEFTEGHYLKDVLKEKIFLDGDPDFQIIREIEARWMFSVIMNGMWHFERAYILDTNTNDRERGYRGPRENHICLPNSRTEV
jgi:hypothetical protein